MLLSSSLLFFQEHINSPEKFLKKVVKVVVETTLTCVLCLQYREELYKCKLLHLWGFSVLFYYKKFKSKEDKIMINDYLELILNQGHIGSEKDFRIFWLCHNLLDDKNPYDIDYPENFKPSYNIELKEGIAKILIERIPDCELTPDTFCRYRCKPDTPILFYDYDGIFYESYSDLQTAYVNKQLQDYRLRLEDCQMTIGELDSLCLNRSDWDAGKNYTHFLDEGRILVEGFPVSDGYTAIYADIEPLSGYEVTDNADEAEYFRDFPVQINFLYTEQVW